MSTDLQVSTVFTGLTRPAMVMGVTLDYMSLCFIFVLCAFILFNSFFYLALYLPLHVFGWIGCKIDHNIFRILIKKLEFVNTPNSKIWGCRSYEPF